MTTPELEAEYAEDEFSYRRPPKGGYFLTPEFHMWPDVQAAGPYAIGTYVALGMWATAQGYDGDIYDFYVGHVGGGRAAMNKLIRVGLMSKRGKGRHGEAYGHVTLAQLQVRRGYRGTIMMVSGLVPNSPAGCAAGISAFGAWALAASWSLTTFEPGFITREAVTRLRIQRYVKRLCAPCSYGTPLWEPVDGGWWMSEGDHPLEARWMIARNDERDPIPDDIRRHVYSRDGYKCVWCGSTDNLSLDHIYAWSRGGPDTVDNLRTLCRPCNSSKGARIEASHSRKKVRALWPAATAACSRPFGTMGTSAACHRTPGSATCS